MKGISQSILFLKSGGLVGSFFIIFLVVLTMYNIFNLRQEWTTNPPPFIGSNAILATNVMNSVQIVVFTQIYNVFANFLNKIENHKILSSYENSYIAKLFLFQFFNTFNSLILISFFNSIPPFSSLNLCASQVVQTTVVDGKTVKKTVPGEINCFSVLQSNIITIFLTMIIKTILEVVIPFATQKAMELLKKKLLSRGEMHPFTKIDKEIENQSLLKPYMTNDDLDGTVQDYLQLIVKFSFLTLFGLSFPPTFAIAFGNNIIQLQVDKIKLIYLYQRPIPKGASNIGTQTLSIILNIIYSKLIQVLGSLFYRLLVLLPPLVMLVKIFHQIYSLTNNILNLGLIIYTSKYRDYLSGNEPLITFVSLLILFLIPDVPEKALIISKRNQVAVERINKGFKKDISRQVTVSNLNFNTQGIKYKKNE